MQAVIGRRVRLIVPVGLEKRINGNLDELAAKLNAPGANGLRLLPIPGQVFTEIDALAQLTGAAAELFAAGGVCGAEGGVWLAVNGQLSQEEAAGKLWSHCRTNPLLPSEARPISIFPGLYFLQNLPVQHRDGDGRPCEIAS